MNTIKIKLLKNQFLVSYETINFFLKRFKIHTVKVIDDTGKVGTIDFSKMLSNKQKHQIIEKISQSYTKAELYNSPLIDELLKEIDPAEANRIEKEMILETTIQDEKLKKNIKP